jgi:hypothetical protein
MYKTVEDDNSFVRDSNNNAILNIDNVALLAYKTRKNATMQIKNDVEELRREMQEIRKLLIKILDK